jgi:biotin carboxylase
MSAATIERTPAHTVTREELTQYFQELLGQMNTRCAVVGYGLDTFDVEYTGGLSLGEIEPRLYSEENGVRMKLRFVPVARMAKGANHDG